MVVLVFAETITTLMDVTVMNPVLIMVIAVTTIVKNVDLTLVPVAKVRVEDILILTTVTAILPVLLMVIVVTTINLYVWMEMILMA